MPYPNPDNVTRQLWRPSEQGAIPQIYVILDAARNESIYPAVMNFGGEYCCLYGEEVPQAVAEAAPYLVKLQQEAPFTARLIGKGWGDSWGIFLESDSSLEELRQHFGQFIMAKDETGREFYFRYYDPRVLRAYLPTCNEAELETLFGPVDSFLVEGEDVNTIIKYFCTDWKLNVDIIPLS